MIAIRGILAVCERNLRVLRRMLWSAVLGHVGEPFFYLLVFGYGFGKAMGAVNGEPFVAWLYPGIAVMSAATSATLECTYSAFTRMDRQKTYLAIAATPISIEEVVVGEALWGAVLGVANALATMVAVALVFGVAIEPATLGKLVVLAFLAGLLGASMALLYTSFARGYEAFAVYFTLVLTPSAVLAGAYFPLAIYPEPVRVVAMFLPFTQPVLAARGDGAGLAVHAAATLLYTVPFLVLAVRRIARRVIP